MRDTGLPLYEIYFSSRQYLSIPERNKLSLLIQAEIPDLFEVHAEAEEEALLELHDDEVVVVEEGTDTRIKLYKQSDGICTFVQFIHFYTPNKFL